MLLENKIKTLCARSRAKKPHLFCVFLGPKPPKNANSGRGNTYPGFTELRKNTNTIGMLKTKIYRASFNFQLPFLLGFSGFKALHFPPYMTPPHNAPPVFWLLLYSLKILALVFCVADHVWPPFMTPQGFGTPTGGSYKGVSGILRDRFQRNPHHKNNKQLRSWSIFSKYLGIFGIFLKNSPPLGQRTKSPNSLGPKYHDVKMKWRIINQAKENIYVEKWIENGGEPFKPFRKMLTHFGTK